METINDIVREMRIGDIRATANTSSAIERKAFEYINDFLNGYADRIEAATKALEADRDNWREQAFAEASRANAATCQESRQVGNAAKMREALEKVVEIAKREWNAFRETSAMYEMHEICTAALAAPPRNCDKIHDVHEMSIAESPLDMSLVVAPREELLRFIYWLFAEAKGEAK
jgi:hypothetical protein